MNIPADGKWLWRFSTRSQFDEVQREIQKRKFYATLPHKLDNAVDDYNKAAGPSVPVVKSKFVEKGEFGEDGWSISRSLDLEADD